MCFYWWSEYSSRSSKCEGKLYNVTFSSIKVIWKNKTKQNKVIFTCSFYILVVYCLFRSNHSNVFYKVGVLKHFVSECQVHGYSNHSFCSRYFMLLFICSFIFFLQEVLFTLFIHFRSSLPELFCKKFVLRKFIKFTRKHLCQSLFFNKVASLKPFLKKRLWHRCFPVNFVKLLRKPFLTEHLRWLLLLLNFCMTVQCNVQKQLSTGVLRKRCFEKELY